MVPTIQPNCLVPTPDFPKKRQQQTPHDILSSVTSLAHHLEGSAFQMVTMGQGPSSHSRTNHNGTRRGLPSRSSIIVNSNGSIINTDPDPLYHPNPDNDNGDSASHNNNNRVPSPLESASYLHQRKSTSSLSRIFMNRKWKKRRGSISASFSINENDIKVRLLY